MPAGPSEFPRGWTLTTDTNGGTASITVAGSTGVAHVLDAFTAKMVDTVGPRGALITLTSSDGIYTAVPLAHLYSANVSDDASGSDLGLAAGPGASITVAFSLAVTSEFLMIQGHDI